MESDDWESAGRTEFDRYEWNAEKAVKNAKKHGVAFRDATQVFSGPHLVSEIYEGEEWRSVALGRERGRTLFVVFTEPEERVCRVISARRATPRERRAYRRIFG